MRASPASAGLRFFVLIFLGSVVISALDAGAAQPPQKDKKDDPAKIQPRTSDTPPAKAEAPKTFTFEMRDKPWRQVIEWLAEITGLKFIGTNVPSGTFNFIDPKKTKYTIPEIIDLINEGLLSAEPTQKWTILRRAQSFTLVPADQPIDDVLVPHIEESELDQRGNSEVVALTFESKGLVAEDIAPSIEKKLMTPFGKVAVFAEANQMVLRDTAGNLKNII